jgi:DNA-binding NtrC family response regulator
VARHLSRRRNPETFISDEVLAVLKAHNWPGNVRELANALEHAAILCDGPTMRPEDLPAGVLGRSSRPRGATEALASPGRAKTLREIELEVILETLARNQGDKPRTAQELGIALKTLYNKLNQSQAQQEGEADPRAA